VRFIEKKKKISKIVKFIGVSIRILLFIFDNDYHSIFYLIQPNQRKQNCIFDWWWRWRIDKNQVHLHMIKAPHIRSVHPK